MHARLFSFPTKSVKQSINSLLRSSSSRASPCNGMFFSSVSAANLNAVIELPFVHWRMGLVQLYRTRNCHLLPDKSTPCFFGLQHVSNAISNSVFHRSLPTANQGSLTRKIAMLPRALWSLRGGPMDWHCQSSFFVPDQAHSPRERDGSRSLAAPSKSRCQWRIVGATLQLSPRRAVEKNAWFGLARAQEGMQASQSEFRS